MSLLIILGQIMVLPAIVAMLAEPRAAIALCQSAGRRSLPCHDFAVQLTMTHGVVRRG